MDYIETLTSILETVRDALAAESDIDISLEDAENSDLYSSVESLAIEIDNLFEEIDNVEGDRGTALEIVNQIESVIKDLLKNLRESIAANMNKA